MPTYLGAFSGIGGIESAFRNSGFDIVGMIENDEFCTKVNEKNFPDVAKYGDIRTLSARKGKGWKRYRQLELSTTPDVFGGGFPCQDISIAGNGAGIAGSRSGLFFEFARLASEIRPKYIFLENVPAITHRGGLIVAGELTRMGYSPQWGIIRASDFGFPQVRARWFCIAIGDDVVNALRQRYICEANEQCLCEGIGNACTEQWGGESSQAITTNPILVNTDSPGSMDKPRYSNGRKRQALPENKHGECLRCKTIRSGELVNTTGAGLEGASGKEPQSCYTTRIAKQSNEPGMVRVFDGLSARVDSYKQVARPNEIQHEWEPPRTIEEKTDFWNQRIKALGNAVVPQVIEPIAKRLYEMIGA